MVIDKPEFSEIKNLVAKPFSELNLGRNVGFESKNLLFAKIHDKDEAEKIINYKSQFLFENKSFITTQPHLINIPIWVMKVKNKNIEVCGIDKNHGKFLAYELNKLFPKSEPTQTDIFFDSVNIVRKPKRLVFNVWKYLKKTNKFLLTIAILLIVCIIIFIIKKILIIIK